MQLNTTKFQEVAKHLVSAGCLINKAFDCLNVRSLCNSEANRRGYKSAEDERIRVKIPYDIKSESIWTPTFAVVRGRLLELP